MVKPILQIGTPILTQKTKPVKDIDSKEVQSIITDLLDTCKENEDISAGLASPQIGYDTRICVCRRVDLEEKSPADPLPFEQLWEILINPKIIKSGKTKSIEWEACLSIGEGDDNIWGPVERIKNVTVEFLTPKGKTKRISARGYFSHVIQHEIDHLNGVLFVTHVSNPQNLWKLKDLNKYIEEHQSYPEIV